MEIRRSHKIVCWHIYSFAMITRARSKESVFIQTDQDWQWSGLCAISVKCSLESWVVVHLVKRKLTHFSFGLYKLTSSSLV